jgi:hypothetical protein
LIGGVEVEAGDEVDQTDPTDGRDIEIGMGGRTLSSVFREEDQVSLPATSGEAVYRVGD